ncbi:MAG: tetratricopeptide repeat protein [Bacteroidota bacterium]
MSCLNSNKRIPFFLCCLLLCFSHALLGQDQYKADSLKALLGGGNLPVTSEMAIMAKISTYSSSPDEVLLYANRLLALAAKNKKPPYMVEAYHYRGVAYRLKGDLKIALKNLFASATLAAANKLFELEAEAYGEIANTYTANKDYKNALVYNKKAIAIMRVHGNNERLAANLLNTGYNYYLLNELDSAMKMYNEAEPLFINLNLTIGIAYTIGNRALVYWKQGRYVTVEKDLLRAIAMLQPLDDRFGMADYHNYLGSLYAQQGETDKAIAHTLKARDMAKGLNLKEQMRDASLLLSKLYEAKKDYQKAYIYKSLYIVYHDSIENTENTKQIANLRTEFEINLKEKEIALLEKHQLLNRIYIIITVSLLLISVLLLLYFRQRFTNVRLLAANERKEHSEKIKTLLSAQETKTLQSIIQGQEKERKRIAQELHNHFGSLMATIKVNLNAIDEHAIFNYHTLTTLVDQACADVRNLSHALNMGISGNFGLVPALKELTAHIKQSNELEVEFSAAMCSEQIGSENELFIYRIVQELLSNVLKHSGATKLSVLLTCFDDLGLINIIVQDNGKGFNVKQERKNNAGMGLKGLEDMVADRHGDIKFDSNPASGTTVIIDLPINPTA